MENGSYVGFARTSVYLCGCDGSEKRKTRHSSWSDVTEDFCGCKQQTTLAISNCNGSRASCCSLPKQPPQNSQREPRPGLQNRKSRCCFGQPSIACLTYRDLLTACPITISASIGDSWSGMRFAQSGLCQGITLKRRVRCDSRAEASCLAACQSLLDFL